MNQTNTDNFCSRCHQNWAVHNDDGSCINDAQEEKKSQRIYNFDGTKLKCDKCGGYEFIVTKLERLKTVVTGTKDDPMEVQNICFLSENMISDFKCVECEQEIENDQWQQFYVDTKEHIAALIFDYEGSDYIRPSEDDCHQIAEEIIEHIFKE